MRGISGQTREDRIDGGQAKHIKVRVGQIIYF